MDLKGSFDGWFVEQQAQIDKLNSDLLASQAKVTELTATNASQSDAMRALSKDSEALKSQLASANLTITTKDATIADLQSKIAKLAKPYGVNTHPTNEVAYTGNYAEQAKAIKSMNMNAVRINLRADPATGLIAGEDKFKQVVATHDGIKIYPMVYCTGLNFAAKTDVELKANTDKGFALGSKFMGNYKQYFDFIEMGNEMYIPSIKPGMSGQNLTDYVDGTLKAMFAFLTGMAAGIRSVSPACQIAINATWTHFGFVQYMIDNGLKFDVLTWHWYYNQDRDRTNQKFDLIENILKVKFPGYRLFFNEVGFSNDGTKTEDDALAMLPMWKRLANSPIVDALFGYELLDQPTKKGAEANFGFFKDVNTPKKVVAQLNK